MLSPIVKIIILAVIQGLAELLPVSSSAHVIVGEKLMGIDPSSAQATLMLVMLHTGTMFAVIVYFWSAWKKAFFSSSVAFWRFATKIVIATLVTGILGFGIKTGIEHYLQRQHPTQEKAEIEEIFGRLDLIAGALAAAGVLILISGIASARKRRDRMGITTGDSVAIGAIQGLCLPFRGFSRSGATISVGLIRGVSRQRVEEFSFALAVVLTPVVVGREAMRLVSHHGETAKAVVSVNDFLPSLLGMLFSFLAGLIALKVLSALLEKGQWWLFGVYCLLASGGIFWMHLHGY